VDHFLPVVDIILPSFDFPPLLYCDGVSPSQAASWRPFLKSWALPILATSAQAVITVFPVHALSLARYRQTFWPSGAKDDPQDAELALELMLRYPKKIKAIESDNADIRLLQQLVEQRRQLIEDKRRFVNRLINTLKLISSLKTVPV
jgi:hypothetical protein